MLGRTATSNDQDPAEDSKKMPGSHFAIHQQRLRREKEAREKAEKEEEGDSYGNEDEDSYYSYGDDDQDGNDDDDDEGDEVKEQLEYDDDKDYSPGKLSRFTLVDKSVNLRDEG